MSTIQISGRNVDALARTSMSEVGHFGRYGEATLKGGVEAVVDTIINRVVKPAFRPTTIDGVVNAPFQFSAIGAPGGTGTWERLRPARPEITAIVERHLAERANGKSCTVEGAGHFLNPHLSSRNALRQWGNHVVRNAVKVWGRGTDIHYHGYAPGERTPPPYTLVYGGASCDFSGRGVAQERRPLLAGAALAYEEDETVGPMLSYDMTAEIPAYDLAAEALDFDGTMLTRDDVAAMQAPEENLTTAIRAYRVERLPARALDELQDTLNSLAVEGWRLRQILPDKKDLLLVVEGIRHEELEEEADDSLDTKAISSLTGALEEDPDAFKDLMALRAPDATTFDRDAFAELFDGLNLKYFRPEEFLVLGAGHYAGRCKGLNTAPPRALWRNILPTARVLDALRERLGAPITMNSVYRSPPYNACLDGTASGSMHMKFMAVDFVCDDGQGPVHWAKTLKAMRDAGVFKGGIGVYNSFVHVDTRGRNANFGPRQHLVF